jgi:hypothetical protein
MNGRAPSDLDVNNAVRRALVRRQIDLGWLSFHTARGNVYVQGDLLALPGADPLTPAVVGGLFDEVGRSPGVKGLFIELRNWTHNSANTGWQPAQGAAGKRPTNAASLESLTFIVD